jgi:protein TonB
VKNDTLGVPVLASFAIHFLVILLGSVIIRNNNVRRDFLPIDLVDLRRENPPLEKKITAPPELKNLPLPPPPIAKASIAKPEAPASLPAPVKEEPTKPLETKLAAPAKLEPSPGFASSARVEGGGSEAGAGNLFGKGDVGVVPGTGTAGGGGGTAASGLGRGSGAPGLPAQTILKTNREAKAIQTVRAVYPPMALRMGMESDVTLRIEVDPQGNVIKAEILKSGGPGFDEEALKAVKQSRFEPAQRDGHNVPAEFTYIYRFRLQR